MPVLCLDEKPKKSYMELKRSLVPRVCPDPLVVWAYTANLVVSCQS